MTRAWIGVLVLVSAAHGQPTQAEQVFGEVRGAQDRLLLSNGDELRGEVVLDTLDFVWRLTDLRVPVEEVAGVQVDRRSGEVLITEAGDRLSGYVRTPYWTVRLGGVPEPVRIPVTSTRRVVFAARTRARSEEGLLVAFRWGDHARLEVFDPECLLDLGFEQVRFDLREVHAVLPGPGETTRLERPSRAAVHGRLQRRVWRAGHSFAEEAFELPVGGVVGVYVTPESVPVHLRRGATPTRFDFRHGVAPWEASSGTADTVWIHEGGSVRVCGPGGVAYGHHAVATLTSPPLPLSAGRASILRVELRARLEQGGDYFAVQLSYDGEAFETAERITGVTDAPVEVVLREAQQVVVRFELRSDYAIAREGVWVDEVEVLRP